MTPTRRALLATGAAVLATRPARAATTLDDASRLNPTPVARHIIVPPDRAAATLATLRAELRDAASAGRPVAFGAARHSMGGQSLARDGTALTFAPGGCEPDRAAGTFRAGPGTRWHDVVAALDPIGFSPAVMQSNHDFGVASTLSVNAHGWPVPYGPFGATVRTCRLLLADGSVVTCSRTENAELFGLVMGGYGLFGVILELEAAMVPNARLFPGFERMPAAEFGRRFPTLCRRPDITMAYGRLDIARHGFMDHALMIGYTPRPNPAGTLLPAGTGGTLAAASRELYRAQTGSEPVKRLRWFMESEIAPRLLEGEATRNALLNEPVSNLASRDRTRTDILHEYFIPPDRFPGFLDACRAVIPASEQELLNVTLRFIDADTTSRLAYAPTARISAVMSFTQRMTPAAEADMQRMTRALIDRVLDLGGSFYMPYRLHATRAQLRRAYPGTESFIEAKRRIDPGLLFRNTLWDTWMAAA